jgi:hypothetical protein
MRLGILLMVLLVGGCSGADIQQYRDRQPHFDLFDYFHGKTRGWGIVQNRSGIVTRQFVVDIVGTVDQNKQLILTEDFHFDDGEKSRRIWTIARNGDYGYQGSAADVTGGAEGMALGNALQWQYQLSLKVGDSTWLVDMDDWMYLQPDDILLNKTKMSKFGLHLADITIVFRKFSGGNRS